jgi:hypothetical protein
MSHKARIASLFTFALVLALSQGVAQAQVVKAFKITGGGSAPQGIFLTPGTPGIHYATGDATELHRYSCVGMFQLLGPNTFSSAPYCIFIAEDGDVLACTYGDVTNGATGPGMITLTPGPDGTFTARFVAEFNPVPGLCTGRFAKLTGGSFLMIAKSSPFTLGATQTTPFTYTWEGNGSLTFAQGK